MHIKKVVYLIFVLVCSVSLYGRASAQGGWRQWDIRMVDGSRVQASPLQMKADGRFTRSMDPKERGILRSKIDYLSPSRKGLPPAPDGRFKHDLVVRLDGTRSFGKITFKTLKFSEGTIVQNGKEMTLEDVAYIKFAHPKKKRAVAKH